MAVKKMNASWFYHDNDMRNDIKIKALRRKFGLEGYAVYNCILEMLSAADCSTLPFTPMDIELMAADLDIDCQRLTDIASYCAKIELLDITGSKLTCHALTRRFESLVDLKSRRSAAGRAGMNSRWHNKAKKIDNTGITNVENSVTDHNNVMEIDNSVITDHNNVTEIDNTGITMLQKSITNHNNVMEIDNTGITMLQKSITNHNNVMEIDNSVMEEKEEKEKEEKERKEKKERKEAKERKEKEKEKEKEKSRHSEKEKSRHFVQPSPVEVQAYCNKRNNGISGEMFCSFYNSKDWMIGKSPMKDWKAAVITWEQRQKREDSLRTTSPNLGVGEFINAQGGRTYGDGSHIVPMNAPKRLSSQDIWDSANQRWVVI